MIVMAQSKPNTRCVRVIVIPPTMIQITFMTKLRQPEVEPSSTNDLLTEGKERKQRELHTLHAKRDADDGQTEEQPRDEVLEEEEDPSPDDNPENIADDGYGVLLRLY